MTDQPLIDSPIRDQVVTADQASDAAPGFHTILEVWKAILDPAEAESRTRITPQWASRICAKHQDVHFADMVEFRNRYFAKIEELRRTVEAVIESVKGGP